MFTKVTLKLTFPKIAKTMHHCDNDHAHLEPNDTVPIFVLILGVRMYLSMLFHIVLQYAIC